jgi:2-oxoglutarate dehydrogenase E2 component (dihydrolipoamide succinyltransferase)
MPQLGETVTEGTITKWFKSVGDQVARDEPLFEVSTDKVDSEVPSPAEGVLTEILVEEGATVDVGARLAVIGDGPGANGTGPPAGESSPQPAPPAPAPPAPATPTQATAERVTESTDRPTPVESGHTPAGTPATGPVGVASPVSGSGEGLVLSPVVRKLLDEHDIDPSTVTGTGLGGRITRSDVEGVIGQRPAVAPSDGRGEPAPVPSMADRPRPAVAPQPERPGASPSADHDEIVPFTNIRRRTAEHMVRSKATSAHTLMVKEIDYERVEQVRRSHGERFKADEGFSLSYLPFAARAAVESLAEFPHLNASVGDDALIIHHDINLGIAVDLDNEGLIVPVVHNAEELNLLGMARRIRDVAERARTKRLSLDDISGGTFSITNAGPFGTLITGAIINQPQVAILSTDGVTRKPVVVALDDGTESIAIHSVGLVAMTFDHRAVDGAYVARYLARLSEVLNGRDWAGEL